MNREFLEGLGLEKDAIDKVMAEHGKAIQTEKTASTEKDTELETLKEQMKQRDADIAELKGKSGSDEDLKAQLDAMTAKYEEETSELESKLSQTRLDSALELALVSEKARNSKAVRALIDVDKLELNEDGTLKGLDDQLKTVQTENPYLFDDGNTTPGQFARHGNPSGASGKTDAFAEIASKYNGKEE